jgi:LmbE family N-acetylglucosaminyl deacetylase
VARIVVLSPHSDDGVLSLGACMARWARAGARVELLTVLALDPDSSASTGGWDRRAGFTTEGAAARARRAEDAAACGALGVSAGWLPFGSVDYDRHGDDETVWSALQDDLVAADVVLVPGAPLTHPDHAWLHDLVRMRLPAGATALYAEQPYTLREGGSPFVPAAVGASDRVAKWRAVRAYRSQLPLLGMRDSIRRGPLRLAWADERIVWPDGLDGPPSLPADRRSASAESPVAEDP